MTNSIDADFQTLLALDWQQQASRFIVVHCPPCVYPLSTRHHWKWSNLPGLLLPYLPIASNYTLVVGTTSEHFWIWTWCSFHTAQTHKKVSS